MRYFTVSEMIKSDTAIRMKVWNGANREQEDNLIALVDNVLDPARTAYGKPIKVESGFRSERVNAAIPNASRTSQHLKGEAADIKTSAGASGNLEVAKIIIRLGKFDQLILEEVQGKSLAPQWVHVSWKRNGVNRHEIRKHVKGTGNLYPVVTKKELGL